jgi:hypothetical protein
MCFTEDSYTYAQNYSLLSIRKVPVLRHNKGTGCERNNIFKFPIYLQLMKIRYFRQLSMFFFFISQFNNLFSYAVMFLNTVCSAYCHTLFREVINPYCRASIYYPLFLSYIKGRIYAEGIL